jgi:predicted DNA-binding transcriptional regulator AlpA
MSDPQAGQRARRALEQAGGLVSVQELASRWTMSRQAVDKRTRADDFPSPIKVTPVTRLFLWCEVDLWQQERKA